MTAAAITYMVPEPFEQAVESVKRAVLGGGLSIPAEMDVSSRIRRELGIAVRACRLIYVDCPVLLMEALAQHTAAALFFPLHVVVAGQELQTQVHVLSSLKNRQLGLPPGICVPVDRLQARLCQALEAIAGRQSRFEMHS